MYLVYVFKELDKTLGNSVRKLWYDTPQKATPEYGQQAVINYIVLTWEQISMATKKLMKSTGNARNITYMNIHVGIKNIDLQIV